MRDGLRLQSGSRRVGEEWWEWWIYLEGPDELLDRVASVRYTLHPTFPEPVQPVSDRATKFRLDSSGWGEFAIAAKVSLKDGTERVLEHWLALAGESTEEAESSRRPTVFLSYGATDAPFVRQLESGLRERGIGVLSSDQLSAGESLGRSISDCLHQADALVPLIRGELRGFAEEELGVAQRLNKPIVPILLGPRGTGGSLPSSLAEVQALEWSSEGDLEAVADAVAARVKDAFFPDEG